MAVGAGEYVLSAIVTLITMVVLWLFPSIELRIDRIRHTCAYQVVCHPGALSTQQLESIISEAGLKLLNNKQTQFPAPPVPPVEGPEDDSPPPSSPQPAMRSVTRVGTRQRRSECIGKVLPGPTS